MARLYIGLYIIVCIIIAYFFWKTKKRGKKEISILLQNILLTLVLTPILFILIEFIKKNTPHNKV